MKNIPNAKYMLWVMEGLGSKKTFRECFEYAHEFYVAKYKLVPNQAEINPELFAQEFPDNTSGRETLDGVEISPSKSLYHKGLLLLGGHNAG